MARTHTRAGCLVTVESVHGYKGLRLTSQAPVGYILMHGDKVVGALELTDTNPGVYLPRDLAPNLERAVHIVCTVLSVLRDPANLALED
jgi:hypothetical protein